MSPTRPGQNAIKSTLCWKAGRAKIKNFQTSLVLINSNPKLYVLLHDLYLLQFAFVEVISIYSDNILWELRSRLSFFSVIFELLFNNCYHFQRVCVINTVFGEDVRHFSRYCTQAVLLDSKHYLRRFLSILNCYLHRNIG